MSELRRTLQSLACGKKRVLRKQPLGKDVNDDDVFYFNPDFTDPAHRVHINSIQVKETVRVLIRRGHCFFSHSTLMTPFRLGLSWVILEQPEESKKTQTLIESDRKHVLDAAIVRVMKAKKELHNEQLKTLTIDAVKNHFVPDVSMIKERITELVEQEYMRRSEDDMNVFVYVA